MLMVSTGFKAAILGPQSFAQIFNGGQIHVYTGVRPAAAETAANEANRIATVRTTTGLNLTFAQNGAFVGIPIGAQWQMLAINTGTATWFRLVGPSDTNQTSYGDARIDGDIGTPTNPQELVLASPNFSAGQAITLDSFLFTLPPL